MKLESTYQKLLDADFDQLGPNLQYVHGPSSSIFAQGKVDVVHGKGMMVWLANWIMKVPPARENTVLRLEIRRKPEQEIWIRDFGGKPLVTRQWAENGFLLEAVGPVKMAMFLRVSDGTLRFEPAFTKIIGLKVPKFMEITVFAQVAELEEGWKILVETRSAILGLLFRYAGTIELIS